MKLLLTGGTGFFGKALLRYFLNLPPSDIEISILTRDPEGFLSKNPEFFAYEALVFLKGDIQVRDSLPWNQHFSHILHAATDSTYSSNLSPIHRFDQIVDGTRNLLDLAVSVGARRFLLTSSGAIYGPQPSDLCALPENWLVSPLLSEPSTAYGHAKRVAEHLCALVGHQYGLETVVARCFAFVGPDLPLNAHYAIGNFISDALTSDAITVSSDGSALRTYLDQTDLAHWLFSILKYGTPGHAYNVGSDHVISISKLACLVRDILSPGKPVRILCEPKCNASRNRYVPDITKVRQQLGLSPNVSLADAISMSGFANSSSHK